MNRIRMLATLGATFALAAGALATGWIGSTGQVVAPFAPISVPFESTRGLVLLSVRVNGTPIDVLLDTGAKPSIVDIDVARELGLGLTGRVNVSGTGAGSINGAFVRAAFSADGGNRRYRLHAIVHRRSRLPCPDTAVARPPHLQA